MVKRRIFVSVTSDKGLDERRKALKAAILKKLREVQLEPQIFWESGMAENLAWNFENVEKVMRKCVGAIVIGFPRWRFQDGHSEKRLLGDYNNFEGAVAFTNNLPLFLIAEEGVRNSGIIWTGGGELITSVPRDAQSTWVGSEGFEKRFASWRRSIDHRRDVFLGYCSQNTGTAAIIENRLNREGATVLNYQVDHGSGVSILNEIREASDRCSCGIFLFAENDPLEGKNDGAAPRDNVVFESGYFMNSKGPDRCLVIRQGNAKMPADLSGAVYVPLADANDISSIETRLKSFLNENL